MTPKQTHSALIAARSLLSDPTCWTKDCMARNANGKIVAPQNYNAACFCAVGALRSAGVMPSDDDEGGPLYLLASVLPAPLRNPADPGRRHPFDVVVSFNDASATTYEQVLEMFDKAISVSAGRLE